MFCSDKLCDKILSKAIMYQLQPKSQCQGIWLIDANRDIIDKDSIQETGLMYDSSRTDHYTDQCLLMVLTHFGVFILGQLVIPLGILIKPFAYMLLN